jgi:hypothetical protein
MAADSEWRRGQALKASERLSVKGSMSNNRHILLLANRFQYLVEINPTGAEQTNCIKCVMSFHSNYSTYAERKTPVVGI